eukprot:TRINITY_DN6555_c0_g1_i1.p2 TRINITY_DN6555_c0_g1~~TRINITY_DN6555_c0_g1_i1.p2  ORF type:complete len:427 (+),score=155.45 TRINITY_DN6555_c0_g1_i1:230-1510(+)
MAEVIAPQLFVGIMKLTVGTGAACAASTAIVLWGSEVPACGATVACGGEEDPRRRRWARRYTHPAAEEDEDCEHQADEAVERESREAEEYMTKVLTAMLMGGGVALVGSIPVTALLYGEPLTVAATQAGLAAVFFSPVVVLWTRAGRHAEDGTGARIVARHLPSYVLALTLLNMGFSIGTLAYQFVAVGHYPFGGIVSKAAFLKMDQDDALQYLTGCRLALMGTSAIFLGIFANRFASIQRTKRLCSDVHPGVVVGNAFLIDSCQVLGNVVAATTLIGALTDSVGSYSTTPPLLEMMRLAYMFGLQASLNTPSEDHDSGTVWNMARSALIGLHAVVIVPSPTSEVAMMAQASLEESSYAAWFGTFDREWRPTEVRERQRLEAAKPAPEIPPMKCWCCCCGFQVGGEEEHVAESDDDVRCRRQEEEH